MTKIIVWALILCIGLPYELGPIRLNDLALMSMATFSVINIIAYRSVNRIHIDFVLIGLIIYFIIGLIMGIFGCQYWPKSFSSYIVTSGVYFLMISTYFARDLWSRLFHQKRTLNAVKESTLGLIIIYILYAAYQIVTGNFTGDYLYAIPFYESASVASACTIALITLIFCYASWGNEKLYNKSNKSRKAYSEGPIRYAVIVVSTILIFTTLSRTTIAATLIAGAFVLTVSIAGTNKLKTSLKALLKIKTRNIIYFCILFSSAGIAIKIIIDRLAGGQIISSQLLDILIERLINFVGGVEVRTEVHSFELARLGVDTYIFGSGFGCYEYDLNSISRVLHGTNTRILIVSGMLGAITVFSTTLIEFWKKFQATTKESSFNNLYSLYIISFLIVFGFGYDILNIRSTLFLIILYGVTKTNIMNKA